MPLYIRLSEYALETARYELRREPEFHFSSFRLRPQVSFAMNLREACDTEPLLQGAISEPQIVVVGPVTLVPLADFQEEDAARLYDFCFPSERRRRVFYDPVPRAGAMLLFALDEVLCQKLLEAFPDAHFLSAQTALLRHFAAKGATRPGKRTFVHLHEGKADIAVFEDERLMLCNSFDVQADTDVAYFTLNVARLHGIDVSDAPFYVAGNGPLREAAITELRKYAANVAGINPSAEYNRHLVAMTPGVPYDLMTLLIEN